MATKPGTSPRVWDSSGVYTTGPFVGSVSKVDPGAGVSAEGHRPGSSFPTAAEHENYQQFHLTTWVRTWLAAGSSAGGANAHILETNAAGRFGAVGATFMDTVDETCVDITAANTFLPAVFVHSAATSFQADMGNSAGVGFAAPIGSGAGVGFTSSLTATSAGGAGLTVDASAGTAADGIRVVHAGGGVGCKLTATGSGIALDVIGSASAQYGGRFVGGGLASLITEGVGTAAGAFILSSATAGALGLAVQLSNNTGAGITVNTPNGSTSAARGIKSSVSGSAVAGEFVAANNYAAIFTGKVAASTFPTTFWTGQSSRPGSTADGGWTYLSAESQFAVASSIDGQWRGVWTTEGGMAQAFASSYGSQYATLGGAGWVNTITAATGSADQPKRAGNLRVRVTFEARTQSPVAGILDYRLVDLVNGANTLTFSGAGTGGTAGTYLAGVSSDWEKTISFTVEIPVTAGARSFRLDIKNGTGGDKNIRRVSIEFLGLY